MVTMQLNMQHLDLQLQTELCSSHMATGREGI